MATEKKAPKGPSQTPQMRAVEKPAARAAAQMATRTATAENRSAENVTVRVLRGQHWLGARKVEGQSQEPAVLTAGTDNDTFVTQRRHIDNLMKNGPKNKFEIVGPVK